MKKISEKKGIKNVKIYGYIENGLKKFNKQIDAICITSRYDGTPNVLGEAVSYGIPCIAPKNVGLSNVILLNGKGGYLYKPNSNKHSRLNITPHAICFFNEFSLLISSSFEFVSI